MEPAARHPMAQHIMSLHPLLRPLPTIRLHRFLITYLVRSVTGKREPLLEAEKDAVRRRRKTSRLSDRGVWTVIAVDTEVVAEDEVTGAKGAEVAIIVVMGIIEDVAVSEAAEEPLKHLAYLHRPNAHAP
jgi:hypothetical protein